MRWSLRAVGRLGLRDVVRVRPRGSRAGIALRAGLVVLAAGAAACAGSSNGPSVDPADAAAVAPADAQYEVYVANESSDLVSRVAFSPAEGARLVDDIRVGIMPADLDGAHGLKVSPDGRHWYVSLAHGTPFGKVWKFTTAGDSLVGRTEAGHFPATMAITPNGELLFVANFRLHGDPEPSSVTVIHTPTVTPVADVTTCVMPHGSRINEAGTKHYSVCMHSEQLVEIDTRTFQLERRLGLAPGHEGPIAADDGAHAGHAMENGDAEVCSPTWATPGRGERANRFVYVPCNKNGEVLEIDVQEWRITRRFPTGEGPYNLDITPDGRTLLATLKGEQAVAVFDLDEGREVERIATAQPVTHGVVVSPDGRYAFISNEAIGSTRGTVDVIDLRRLERVASVEVHHQPGGIDVRR